MTDFAGAGRTGVNLLSAGGTPAAEHDPPSKKDISHEIANVVASPSSSNPHTKPPENRAAILRIAFSPVPAEECEGGEFASICKGALIALVFYI